jgi:hypothetical protein
MINIEEIEKAISEFERLERRADFFALASNLMRNGFEIEAYIILLATWNFASFRYASKEFDLTYFRNEIDILKPHFDTLKNERFESIDITKFDDSIRTIFDRLSCIKGIEFTGAPKIMHLKNPNLFVMWDGYIRGEKPKKDYKNLSILKYGDWTYKQYSKDSNGYLDFLNDMQIRFKNIKPSEISKSMAKAIDEYNYVNVTLPLQEIEKIRKRIKKRGKEESK